jgi:hypothetical protein
MAAADVRADFEKHTFKVGDRVRIARLADKMTTREIIGHRGIISEIDDFAQKQRRSAVQRPAAAFTPCTSRSWISWATISIKHSRRRRASRRSCSRKRIQ